MRPAGRWVTFLALPLLVFFEAGGWYGLKSLLGIYLLEDGSGVAPATVSTLMWVTTLVATVLAGLGALAVGPWPFLVAGTLVTALGAAALALAPSDAALLLGPIFAFGWGLARPAVWGAGARAFGDDREHLRTALFVLCWGSINAAAFIAGLAAGGPLVDELGVRAAVGATSVEALIAFFVATGAAVAIFATRDRTEPVEKPVVRRAHLGAVALLLVVFAGVAGVASEFIGEHVIETAMQVSSPGDDEFGLYMSVGPLAAVLLSIVLAGALAVLHLTKVRLPTVLPAGIGFFCFAAGLVTLLSIDPLDPSPSMLVVGAVLGGTAELLVGALLLSRITGDLPWRAETLVAAMYTLVVQAPHIVQRLLRLVSADEAPEPSTGLAWAAAVFAGIAGLALVALAFPLQRVFARPVPDPQPVPAPGEASSP